MTKERYIKILEDTLKKCEQRNLTVTGYQKGYEDGRIYVLKCIIEDLKELE